MRRNIPSPWFAVIGLLVVGASVVAQTQSKEPPAATSPSPSDTQTPKSAEREAIASLAPERLLDAYAEWLAAAESRVYLKPGEVTVDRMGVIKEAATDERDATLRLPELVGRDRRQWTVLLVRVRREDAEIGRAHV